MKELIFLFLASILAGFALLNVEPVSFLSALGPIFDIIGALAIIIFSLAVLFKGIKSLFGR